jgi:signal transduction histidine kinase
MYTSNSSKISYNDLIPRQNGFVFKFVKKGNDFIHTFIEGEFIKRAGLSPSMVVGKNLFHFLTESQAKQKESFYEMAWNGETVNYEGYLNGYFYIASLTPLIINSKTVEVNGTAIDITKEKMNEIKIQNMEKLSIIGKLAAGIAHEIRNPLTSLIGFTQIIKESNNNPNVEPYLEIMINELERINQIVNEFMLIAKPHESMEIRKIDINILVSNVIKFMEPQSNLKSIMIDSFFDSEVTAYCDPDQIKQVLINVIQNAIEATTDINAKVEISLKNIDTENYLIRIKDMGSGIPEERQKNLFEPFYTTKEKGTGLGLMVCKRIIEIHKGSIDIRSNHDEGTVVDIILPMNTD